MKSSNKNINFLFNLFNHKYFINKKILDAGCGDESIFSSFLKNGAIVTVIDLQQEYIKYINKKYPNVKALKLNFENFLSINNKFDITFSFDALCNIKNYENHLKDLCARTKDLILETAIYDCDHLSELNEDISVHNLYFSEKKSKPSTVKIEKILSESGMSFIRVDSSELNFNKYIYDWEPGNSNNNNFFLRRFWICSKRPYVIKEINKKIKKNSNKITNELNKNNHYVDFVQESSKQHSILLPETFIPNKTWDLQFTVAPMTFSSRQWVKKIQPFFPNLKINKKILNYKSIMTSDDLDLSICSIDNVIPSKNTFIEEWFGEIPLDSLNKLNFCDHIITPSFENYFYLKKCLPNKKISRISKFWLNTGTKNKDSLNYALYFEKNSNFTPKIVDHFSKLNLDKLIVVGSRAKLSKDVDRISEYEDYEKINDLMINAKLIIDASQNQNYDSSIINFAKSHNIHVLTNNYFYINNFENITFIRNKKENNNIILEDDALDFATKKINSITLTESKINSNYNNSMYKKLLSLLGR
jgi:hypothetical protein